MTQLLAVALSFPGVVYTVLLGVALVYWVFVMIGAAHVDVLGDGVADGAVDGVADGAFGGGEHASHASADHASADHGGAGIDGDGHGGLAGLMAALKLRSAPATVVLSLLVFFSWLVTVVGMHFAVDALPAGGVTIMRGALFVLAPILALLPTSFVVRPLAKLFVPSKATKRPDLVGKVCTIRTGKVTERFGEAVLEDGGAGLVVRVRVDTTPGKADAEKLGRGDKAVIVSYDEETQEFTVARLDDGL